MEAQAAGRPVIALRAGGLRETVIDGVTGRLFEPSQTRARWPPRSRTSTRSRSTRRPASRTRRRFAPERFAEAILGVVGEELALRDGAVPAQVNGKHGGRCHRASGGRGALALRTAVVVPNWNGARWLPGCLRAIEAARPGRPTRSSWSTTAPRTARRSWPTRGCPRASVLRLGRNTGFAFAANRGVEAAGADAVALVNTDVVLAPDWLERTATALGATPDVGRGGTKMVDLGDPCVLYDAGDVLRRDGVCEQRGRFTARRRPLRRSPARCSRRAPGPRCTGATPCSTSAASTSACSPTSRTSTSACGCGWPGWRCRYEPAVPRHAGERLELELARPLLDWVERNTLLLVAKAFPLRWAAAASPTARPAGRGTPRASAACAPTCAGAAAALPLLPRCSASAAPARRRGGAGRRRRSRPARSGERMRPLGALRLRALDALDLVSGRGDPLVPPRRLRGRVGDSDFVATGDEMADLLARAAGLREGDRVLDVGCGYGRVARALAARLGAEGSYEGFDASAEAVEWCAGRYARRHPNFHFVHLDVANAVYNPDGALAARGAEFPYDDGVFDIVVVTSVFTHLLADGTDRYLAQSARVLAPGGALLATFLLLDAEARRLQREGAAAISFRQEHWPVAVEDPEQPEAAVGYDESWVRDRLEAQGLTVVEPVRRGAWSGRTEAEGFQDVIVARA